MGRPALADVPKACHACGARMTRQRFSGRLEDRTAFLRRRYCNRACMGRAFVKDTPSSSALRYRTAKYRGTICEQCGATTSLHAHHIDGNLHNDSPQNIQTLCTHCHGSHHHRVRRAGLTVPGRAG